LRCLVLTSIVALQLVAAPARADETEDAAQVHLDRGVDAFHAGEYARAHREFEAAQELAPDRANPYRWLALTEVQLGDCPAALAHIEEFLTRVKPDDERIAELVRLRVLCEKAREPDPEPTPPPPRRRGPSRRALMWGAVGVAVAAVVIGGGAYLIFDEGGGGTTVLPPIHCGDAGCSP
jgi:tetratricopeptide (TPR) repeat protein